MLSRMPQQWICIFFLAWTINVLLPHPGVIPIIPINAASLTKLSSPWKTPRPVADVRLIWKKSTFSWPPVSWWTQLKAQLTREYLLDELAFLLYMQRHSCLNIQWCWHRCLLSMTSLVHQYPYPVQGHQYLKKNNAKFRKAHWESSKRFFSLPGPRKPFFASSMAKRLVIRSNSLSE